MSVKSSVTRLSKILTVNSPNQAVFLISSGLYIEENEDGSVNFVCMVINAFSKYFDPILKLLRVSV